jgi:hypothetical protein
MPRPDSQASVGDVVCLGERASQPAVDGVVPLGCVGGDLFGAPSADLTAMLAGGPVRIFTPFMSM